MVVMCLTEGPGGGFTYMGQDGQQHGAGASHGGEAGAGNSSMDTPSAYGNFISPDQFGSGGGSVGSNKGNGRSERSFFFMVNRFVIKFQMFRTY